MHSRENTGLADGSFLALTLRPGIGFLREKMKSKGGGVALETRQSGWSVRRTMEEKKADKLANKT